MALAGATTISAEQRNTVRYYQAFLYYDAGQWEEAAADGEATLQSPDDSPAARQTARIGLAASEALFHAAHGDSRPATLARLQMLAEKIVQRWGSYPEADDARAVLLDLALAEKRLGKADDYLRQISNRSPRRGEAELGVGQALWSRGQQLLRISTREHDRSAEAESLMARAAELLADGITRCREAVEAGGAAPPSLAGATMALAQIEMARGRPAEAMALMEDRTTVLPDDSYPLTMLAYIAAGELDKARTCLRAESASLPSQGNAERGRQTIQACVRFQRLLKQHLARCRDRRMDDVLAQTRQHCDAFLATPVEGSAADSLFELVWRAEAYAGLAAGLDSGETAAPSDAQRRYRRAIAAFQDVLHRAATDRSFSPAPEVVIALRIDLARCLRRVSDYPQALSQLLAVLKDHPLMVDAQVEAAYTYQSWGDQRPEYLEMAIQGGNRYQEVWGWGELARRVQSEPRFHEVFLEARYNLALCRFRLAQGATARPERSRLAEVAKNDIRATRRVDPDLGGPVWYDRSNELLQRIQQLADQPAAGRSAPK